MDLKKQILVALGLDKGEVQLEWQSKLEDGTIVVSTADALAESVDVSVLTEDGTTIPLPIGTYKTEDGVTFVVSEEGIVDSVSESETEEEVEAAKDEKECPNGYDDEGNCKEDEKTEAADEGSYVTIDDWRAMEERVKNLEDGIADLKESKEGGDDESEEEMSVEPTTNPKSIKTTEVKEFSAEEQLENLKAENEKLKTELAESPAEAPINTNKFSTERPVLTKKQYNKLSRQERFLHNLNK
jgi:hypothetical protein